MQSGCVECSHINSVCDLFLEPPSSKSWIHHCVHGRTAPSSLERSGYFHLLLLCEFFLLNISVQWVNNLQSPKTFWSQTQRAGMWSSVVIDLANRRLIRHPKFISYKSKPFHIVLMAVFTLYTAFFTLLLCLLLLQSSFLLPHSSFGNFIGGIQDFFTWNKMKVKWIMVGS